MRVRQRLKIRCPRGIPALRVQSIRRECPNAAGPFQKTGIDSSLCGSFAACSGDKRQLMAEFIFVANAQNDNFRSSPCTQLGRARKCFGRRKWILICAGEHVLGARLPSPLARVFRSVDFNSKTPNAVRAINIVRRRNRVGRCAHAAHI